MAGQPARAGGIAKVFAPDVIVMDLAMPLVDGVEATRRLKRDPRTKEVPIRRRQETSSGQRRRHRALVVDDNDDTRALYAMYLRHHGWEVEDLANGEEALGVAKVFAPDVIVMDLAMPLVDGVEATRRLKRDPQTKEVPIIVVTAHLLRVHDAIAAGGTDFLLKPCLPQDLLAVLEGIVT